MTSDDLKGYSVIVTGAGQGIGLEICRQLAAHGASVLLNDMDPALTENAVDDINDKYGPLCIGFPGDASNTTFIQRMTNTAVNHFGKLTTVVANAGITLFGEFLDYTPDSFYKLMQTNLGGSFFLAQSAALQMKKQGTGGSILFMSSVTGHQAHKNLAAYGMTKAALELLAKNLVVELSQYKIRVNALAPGATMTERTKEDKTFEKSWTEITPLGKTAQPIDVANAALFLISEKARHITGQSLIIDGGWTSVSPQPF